MTGQGARPRVTILGCGSAGGVPMISWGWGNCDPANPRNRRRRPSILIEQGETRILVDTTPDMREQLLDAKVRHLDAVLYTHEHADHVHGIDDLREVNRAMHASIPVYASKAVLEDIGTRFGYAFDDHDPDRYPIYKPWLTAHEITGPFSVGEIEIIPFEQDHGYTQSLGFRFGPVAYSTDVMEMPEESFKILEGIETWILDCFTDKPHVTHLHVEKALAWIDRIKPKRTVLTHMGPAMDYETLKNALPQGVEPAYDGMVISQSRAKMLD